LSFILSSKEIDNDIISSYLFLLIIAAHAVADW